MNDRVGKEDKNSPSIKNGLSDRYETSTKEEPRKDKKEVPTFVPQLEPLIVKKIEENQQTQHPFLKLNGCNLGHVPGPVLDLIHLKNLYLKSNGLRSLPEVFFSRLPLLEWLDVRDNLLSSLPESLGQHQCLNTLLLEGNHFLELPLQLGLLSTLRGLNFRNNPLIKPPPHVLALGLKEILFYLRERIPIYNEDNTKEGKNRRMLTRSASGTTINPFIPVQDASTPIRSDEKVKKQRNAIIRHLSEEFEGNRKEKLRKIRKEEQDRIQKYLQKMQDELTLKKWRDKAKLEQRKFFYDRTTPAVVNLQTPFDIDENLRFPNRRTLSSNDLDAKPSKPSQTASLDNIRFEKEKKLVQQIKSSLDRLQKSCRMQIVDVKQANEELQKIEKLQNQLKNLFRPVM